MKRLLLLSLLPVFQAHAQLPDGSMAPNFTIQAYQPTLSASGMNSNGSYTLYDYLDAGYTVYAEFTSTLCVPCWNFHQNGILEDLYEHHGPLLPGHPGVDPASTDDVMVIWIDAQGTTPDDWLVDGGPFVNGNWIDPNGTGEVPYPMCNPPLTEANQLMQDYMIPFYPTIYRICPNRTVETVWSADPEILYAASESCPLPTGQHNASLLNWWESSVCPMVECVVTLQNMGTDLLTSAQVVLRKGANVIQTVNWSGNLATYQTADINLGTLNPLLEEEYTAEITTSDDNSADNVIVKTVGPTLVAAGFTIDIEITTDAFGNETRWELFNLQTAEILGMGGPYDMVQPPATVPYGPYEYEVEEGQCYVFNIFDADGMNIGAGEGGYVLRDEPGNIIAQGSVFTDFERQRFYVNGSASLSEGGIAQMKVFPNPAFEKVNLTFEADGSDYAIRAVDLYGRELYTTALNNASGLQTLSIPAENWQAGTYLVTVRKGAGMQTIRLVVA